MKNKAIIITGANGNVGSYFAKNYAEKGENLILVINEKTHRLDEVIKNYPKQIQLLKTDLSRLDQLEKEIAKICCAPEWLPNRLIHTSTIRSHDFQPLADCEPELWSRIIEVNLIGTFNLLKTVIPFFRNNKYGKIVLFGSNVSRIGLASGSAYSCTKAAIANIGRSLAAEEAENNIIVNTLSPGPIKIDESHFSESYRKFREEYYQEKIREIPLRRYATFDDLLGLCNFLLSEDNSYITGEEFFVTGGKL